jgi:hypothetical protein
MNPSNMQLMVIPQRRSGKSEAVLQDIGKLLQDHPDLRVHIHAQNAEELAQELPEDVGHRVFPRPDFSTVEELRESLRPIVLQWIAQRPTEIRIPAFLRRFPDLDYTPLMSKALQQLLAEWNPEYFDSGNRGVDTSLIWVDEWDYVPHDFIMKSIKPLTKHRKNNNK